LSSFRDAELVKNCENYTATQTTLPKLNIYLKPHSL